MLTTLLIDFDHMTPQLLRRISAAAPALCALKLVESKFSRKVRHSVRDVDCAVNDGSTGLIPGFPDAVA